ncbi:MAG: ankyrin repeat domain-containing protein [Micavibrio sp.]|nr:ankyrin repeat domain-containing protein [Micavibrio sp.]
MPQPLSSAFPDSTPRQLGRRLVTELQRLPGECDTKLCVQLIDNGAAVETKGRDNSTPLLLAAFYGYEDVAAALIFKKADLDALSDHQHTPLMMAAALGHLPLVRQLVDAGADLALKDKNGDTALDRAYAFGTSNDAIHARQRPIISELQAAERKRAADVARAQMNAALQDGLATKTPLKPLRPVHFRQG